MLACVRLLETWDMHCNVHALDTRPALEAFLLCVFLLTKWCMRSRETVSKSYHIIIGHIHVYVYSTMQYDENDLGCVCTHILVCIVYVYT